MEFIELCKQKTRMCKKYNNCADGPIELHCERDNRISLDNPAELEMLILEWVAANPEESDRQYEVDGLVKKILAAGQKIIINDEMYIRVQDAIKVIQEGIT